MKTAIILLLYLSGFSAIADGPTPIPSGSTVLSKTNTDEKSLPTNFPDKFAWKLFARICQEAENQVHIDGDANKPLTNNAIWETWADDARTFPNNPDPSDPPRWPSDAEASKKVDPAGFAATIHGTTRTVSPAEKGADVEPLKVGGFNVAGGNGVGEEIRRNKITFDYVLKNGLWYQEGVAEFFKQAAAVANNPTKFAKQTINFPTDSIEVKGNWIVITEEQKPNFHWNYNESGQLLGLVAMHVTSKDLPNWFWATFEHEDNPGLGDYIGIHDAFGASPAHTESNTTQLNQVYEPARMTSALKQLLEENNFHGEWFKQWSHYRLKGSQIDYTDSAGRPLLLGNSVTEAGFVPTASCITCHSRAAVDSHGASVFPIFGEKQSLPLVSVPQNGASGTQGTTFPTYNGVPNPSWFFEFSGKNGTKLRNLQTDFVWAIPFRAKPAKTN